MEMQSHSLAYRIDFGNFSLLQWTEYSVSFIRIGLMFAQNQIDRILPKAIFVIVLQVTSDCIHAIGHYSLEASLSSASKVRLECPGARVL